MIIRFVVFSVVLFVSCKSLPTEKNLHKNETISEAKTMYYYFQAQKKLDTITILLQKDKLTNSKLKGSFSKKIPNNQYITDNWLVSFSSDKDTLQLQIKNPLNEVLEYINENGTFEKRIIHHSKKEFVLRIPYLNSIKSITFEVITTKNGIVTIKKIDTIKLK